MTRLTTIRTFRKAEQGSIAAEVAILSPVFLLACIASLELGVRLKAHQNLDSAVSHGAQYLQDYMGEKEFNSLNTSLPGDTDHPFTITRTIIQESYGDDLKDSSISLTTFCGCPNPDGFNGQSGTFGEDQTKYYEETEIIIDGSGGALCTSPCNDGDSRVSVEIAVNHTIKGIRSDEIPVKQTLRTRLR